MASMALEIGRALRRARLARGLTLKQLAAASAGRFKPTSVAGYERGERSISVVRFCELCQIFGVPADRLLGEVLRATRADPELMIDLTRASSCRASSSRSRHFAGQGMSTGSRFGSATSKCSPRHPADGRMSSKRSWGRSIAGRNAKIPRSPDALGDQVVTGRGTRRIMRFP